MRDEITPNSNTAFEPASDQLWNSEEERLANGVELMKMLRKGFDLGGLRIDNRDELYDRERGPK